MLILLAGHESLDYIQPSEYLVHWFANRQTAIHCRCILPLLLSVVIHKISLLDTKPIFSRRIWANRWGSRSLRKRKRRMKHAWTAKGRKTHIGKEETHGIRAVLQCLNCMLNTMKIGGLLRQPFCHPAMFLTEPLSLFIIIITLFMWALYRPQNAALLHIYFKQAP